MLVLLFICVISIFNLLYIFYVSAENIASKWRQGVLVYFQNREQGIETNSGRGKVST